MSAIAFRANIEIGNTLSMASRSEKGLNKVNKPFSVGLIFPKRASSRTKIVNYGKACIHEQHPVVI
jgi:hypothetical protein